MKIYSVKLKSNSQIAFGRFYTNEVPKLDRESNSDYEVRTWKNRAHVDNDGKVFLPALSIKNALFSAAKYSGKQIQGQGKKTYSQKMASGVLIVKNVPIADQTELKGMWLHVPSDGMKGGSKRVMKCFPIIEAWEAEVEVLVLDEIITADILKEFLIEAGNFIGLGSLRVSTGGILGRFSVGAVTEVKTKSAAA